MPRTSGAQATFSRVFVTITDDLCSLTLGARLTNGVW